jgi:pimeloyl-ACP methyl ester carboxylesterase
MATVTRPDGTRLHVEVRGDGPLVVITPGLWSPPHVFDELVGDLASDHRVVTYDARGTGESDPHGPYDLATDAADLAAVVAAQDAGPATFVAGGVGGNLALRVMRDHSELAHAVISPTGSPVAGAIDTDDTFANSGSVISLLGEMALRDYRSFLRNLIASTNPQLDEDAVRARIGAVVAYTPQEVMVARAQAWVEDDAVPICRDAGDRLWILISAPDQWTSAAAAPATRALLPDAHVLQIEDGPLSRPDLTTEVVRRVTGLAA